MSDSLRPCGLQSITNPGILPKLMSIASVMPSSHLILCRPLLPPSVFPSIRVFSRESVLCTRWPKYWSFSFSISPSKWFPLGLTGLISMLSRDCQESSPTPQFKSLNSSGLSLLYDPTLTSRQEDWKTHSFDYADYGKLMTSLFHMLSRFVMAFLPRSFFFQVFLTLWLQSQSAVILEPKKIKSVTVSTFPIYLPWSEWDQMPWS